MPVCLRVEPFGLLLERAVKLYVISLAKCICTLNTQCTNNLSTRFRPFPFLLSRSFPPFTPPPLPFAQSVPAIMCG